jgi:curved DNA-binding protein CbpA
MEQEDLTPQFILYSILDVPKNAEPKDIKKKYYELARVCHPDKNPDDPAATTNFQKLNEAYKILSDPAKRQIYDKTGDIESTDGNIDSFVTAYQYYRYPQLLLPHLKNFFQ